MRALSLLSFLVTLLALGTSGCAEVAPYQRGSLAHRCMQVAPAPGHEAALLHVLSVREAAAGGNGARGGGCGCN
jgi:hypothetical protein